MQCIRFHLSACRSHDLLSRHLTRHIPHQTLPTSVHHQPLLRYQCRRTFISHVSSVLPAVLVPPVMFLGLGIALWIWKCAMLIVWQNKIIYMPGLPPNSRREHIADYERHCVGIKWRETKTKSADGTEIALCVAATKSRDSTTDSPVYVLFFQGNASSTPSRLPFISPIVRAVEAESETIHVNYVFILVSYRGYWRSQGRANEIGITLDALAALKWISSQQASPSPIPVVIWGQSVGAGVASTLAANHSTSPQDSRIQIRSLVLETPFTNIRDMLVTLYPQKWLPYRYLWPFLRNRLDSLAAMDRIAASQIARPDITIVVAGKDELVPTQHGDMLESKAMKLGIGVRREVVSGALHTEVMGIPAGRKVIVDAIMGRSKDIA